MAPKPKPALGGPVAKPRGSPPPSQRSGSGARASPSPSQRGKPPSQQEQTKPLLEPTVERSDKPEAKPPPKVASPAKSPPPAKSAGDVGLGTTPPATAAALEELRNATAALMELQVVTAANTSAIANLEARAAGTPPKADGSLAPPPATALPPPRRASISVPPPADPAALIDDERGPDKVSIKVTNPMCIFMVALALLALSFSSGYLVREHQSKEEKARFSAIEDFLIKEEGKLVGAVSHLLEPVTDVLDTTTGDGETCADGLLISGPMPTSGNTLLFLLLLLWSFLGVAVFADLFMLAIERITSQEAVKKVTLPSGKMRVIHTLTWNATVANLTLMALGSSAPEILLSVIEIMTSGFFAGELGPSTIVGSAAFNMLVISAVCVMAIPDGSGRLIKELGVFAITAVFSVAAYLWLLVILTVITPNVVDVWEGFITFILFPLLVWLAYLADQGVFTLPTWLGGGGGTSVPVATSKVSRQMIVRDESAFDGGGAGARSASQSKAFYRVNAVRAATGFRSIEEQSDVRRLSLAASTDVNIEQGLFCDIQFFASSVRVREEDKKVDVVIFRKGNTKGPSTIKYICSFAPDAPNQVEFEGGNTSATVEIELLDADRVVHADGAPAFTMKLVEPSATAKIGKISTCEVVAVSDSAPGTLVLAEDLLEVNESDRNAAVVVRRQGGSRGVVSCEVNTKDGSAVAPNDYIAIEDLTLVFEDGEVEKSVPISLINDGNLEGEETFTITFTEVTGGSSFSNDCDGGPERAVCTVVIKGDDASTLSGPPKTCQELAFYMGANADEITLTTFAWSSQFSEAIDFEFESGWVGFIFFLLSLPWKLAIAFAPPPRLMGGWACFIVVLALIGFLTAIIGDLASHMGCCMGLAPAITAITFVALGTSLPDTFASMSAAQSEPYADASIGNITGSNSVNVFLGLGLPWMIAAIYWSTVQRGSEAAIAWHARYASEPWYTPGMPIGFAVPAGDLGFSVGVFCVCAIICLLTLVLRRATIGFELGMAHREATAGFFVLLWFVYIGASVIYSNSK